MTAEQDWNAFKLNSLSWFESAIEFTELLADYTQGEGTEWTHRINSSEPLTDDEWDKLGGMLLELSQNLGTVQAHVHGYMQAVHTMQGGETPDNVRQLIVPPDRTLIVPE